MKSTLRTYCWSNQGFSDLKCDEKKLLPSKNHSIREVVLGSSPVLLGARQTPYTCAISSASTLDAESNIHDNHSFPHVSACISH